MPAIDHASGFRCAVAVLVPLLCSLGGCVAVPLLELAATPTSQAAPCAANTSGVAASGCATGATGSMIPGMGTIMQALAPAAQPVH
jgi:hypothetical protein